MRADGAPVRLYDVEAEADDEFDDRPELLEGRAIGAGGGAPSAGADSEAGVPPEAGAGAIFARLRSIAAQPVGEPSSQPSQPSERSEPSPDRPAAADDAATPTGAAGAAAGPDAEVEEFADEPDELADEFAHTPGDEPADRHDLVGAARAVAVGGIARRLKRLVVDEQGDLLDAIRRNGARAVRTSIAASTASYTRAARVPMQDFASDIDVSIDDIDLKAAGGAILSLLVEPLRARLGDLVEQTEDPDELSGAVRSIYRESRSRHAGAAAEAAFAAGWPEPIS